MKEMTGRVRGQKINKIEGILMGETPCWESTGRDQI